MSGARRAMERERVGLDRGWKTRGVMIDGPGARLGIGRAVPEGQRVVVPIDHDGRRRGAVYESVGRCPEVPPADGVGLTFKGWEDEITPEESDRAVG